MYKKRKIQETSRVAQRTISRSRSDGVELKNHLVSTAIDVGKCRSKYRDYSSFLSLPATLLSQLIKHVSSHFPLFLSSLGALLPTSKRSRIYRLSWPPSRWIGRAISRDKQRGTAFFNCPSLDAETNASRIGQSILKNQRQWPWNVACRTPWLGIYKRGRHRRAKYPFRRLEPHPLAVVSIVNILRVRRNRQRMAQTDALLQTAS